MSPMSLRQIMLLLSVIIAVASATSQDNGDRDTIRAFKNMEKRWLGFDPITGDPVGRETRRVGVLYSPRASDNVDNSKRNYDEIGDSMVNIQNGGTVIEIIEPPYPQEGKKSKHHKKHKHHHGSDSS